MGRSDVATRGVHYTPDMAQTAYRLQLLGLTQAETATVLGVSRTQLQRWCATHPALAAAMDAGGEQADAKVARALYRRAIGFSRRTEKLFVHMGAVIRAETREYYPPDVTACLKWLSNRQRGRWARENGDGPANEMHAISIVIDADTVALSTGQPSAP